METKVYNQQGKETGSITLPESVFNVKWNADLVHQVVTAMQANARTPIAHTKNRAEVSGTGKKPWKQKGTGSARHGSRRSPIWRTGGVAHGPRNERDYGQKINKKMRAKALYAVLTKKFQDGEVLFVNALTFAAPKTKDAKATIAELSKIQGFEKLATRRTNTALIADTTKNDAVQKSFQNFSNLMLEEVRNLNPVEVLRYKFLIIATPEESLKQLEARLTTKKA